MSNNRNSNAAYYLVIIVITLFFGCSMEQSHKTLVFFFDGVNKIAFFNSYLSRDSLSKESVAKRDALLKRNRPDLCVHKPYKEKKCDQCHTPDKRLLMPMPGLCYRCHQDFSKSYTVVHGPVASGSCTNCHNQHSSKYAKLLIRPGQQLCLYCHNSSLVFTNKVHRDIEDAECTLCHSPHGGNSRFMVKNNISHDANRIALMDDLTYRHLYGQIFCKVPGDVNSIMDITILDGRGVTVATAHPDANGKFYLANLHPDQNYTFRFKKDMPDCKINIMDNNGTVLFLLEKNKKEKYVFDKTAYETVHNAINDAHYLGDTLRAGDLAGATSVMVTEPPENNAIGTVASPEPKPATGAREFHDVFNTKETPEIVNTKGKIKVETLPGAFASKDVANIKVTDTTKSELSVEDVAPTTPARKSNIVVAAPPDADGEGVPGTKSKKKGAKDAHELQSGGPIDNAPTAGSKSKIVVTTLPDGSAGNLAGTKKAGTTPAATEAVRRYEVDGATLIDMALQLSNSYQGTVVCVLNDSADFLDAASVDKKGEFLLYGFLSYRLAVPAKSTGIISQTVFVNEKLEVIETINKRVSNGRYVYSSNSRERAANRATVNIIGNKQNAIPFGTLYFANSKIMISPEGRKQLDAVVEYLTRNAMSKVYLVAHSDLLESIDYRNEMSDKRAKAAGDYIVSKGIDRKRITRKGFFEANPGKRVLGEPLPGEESENSRRVDIYIKDN